MSIEMWTKLQEAVADLMSLKEEFAHLKAMYENQTKAFEDYVSRIEKLETKVGRTLTLKK